MQIDSKCLNFVMLKNYFIERFWISAWDILKTEALRGTVFF